eukprot:s1703_g20.t1
MGPRSGAIEISSGYVRGWPGVLGILASVTSCSLRSDEVVYGAALGRLAKERVWQPALALLSSMVCVALRSNLITCSASVGACAKGLKWFFACGILMQMRTLLQVRPNTIAFDSAIHACGGRSGSWEMAIGVFSQLRVINLDPVQMSYNTAMSALEYRQHWERGLELLEELTAWRPQQRICANIVSFNAALSCFRKVSHWQKAVHLLKGIPRICRGISPAGSQVQADDVTYGTAVSACDHGWQWRWALRLLLEGASASRIRCEVMTLNSAMSACAKGTEWQVAIRLLRSMPTQKVVPSKVSYTTALGALGDVALGSSLRPPVLELLMEMMTQRLEPNALAYDLGIDACEAAMAAPNMPELLHFARKAGAAACAAAGPSFEEEDKHGDHSGLAIVAADSLARHSWLDSSLAQRICRQLCKPALERFGVDECRYELEAAETALADRRSQLNFARLLAEKNTLKAHGYHGELQLEQQQTAALEAGAVGLTEVAQELQMSELLCAEARDSAEDALLIRRQAVSAAQVLLQAHALLSSGRCSKASMELNMTSDNAEAAGNPVFHARIRQEVAQIRLQH